MDKSITTFNSSQHAAYNSGSNAPGPVVSGVLRASTNMKNEIIYIKECFDCSGVNGMKLEYLEVMHQSHIEDGHLLSLNAYIDFEEDTRGNGKRTIV